MKPAVLRPLPNSNNFLYLILSCRYHRGNRASLRTQPPTCGINADTSKNATSFTDQGGSNIAQKPAVPRCVWTQYSFAPSNEFFIRHTLHFIE